MENSNIKSKLIRILLSIITILYFVFLYMDLSGIQTFISSNNIKFLSILLVFSISLMIGKNSISSGDACLLKIGLFLTLIADIFLLLFNTHYVLGIGLFSIIQILYAIRYNSKKAKNIILNFSILFVIFLLIYFLIDQFIIKIDFLIVIAIYYGICLLSSVNKAIHLYKSKAYPELNSKFIALGMLLFLLCDINVALYNVVGPTPISSNLIMRLNNISSILIWLFYLPSQVLLSLSGYSREYLKNLFLK